MIPGFENLRNIFKKFAEKYENDDSALRAAKVVASGVKASAERFQVEFTEDFIKQVATDVYTLIASDDVAENLSRMATSLDADRVANILEHSIDALKEQDISESLGEAAQRALRNQDIDELGGKLARSFSGGDPLRAMVINAVFKEVAPDLEALRTAPTTFEAGAIVRDLLNRVPIEAIAEQVEAITAHISPDFIAQQHARVIDGLPTPESAATTAHNVAKKVAERMDDIAKAANMNDVGKSLDQLSRDVKAAKIAAVRNGAAGQKYGRRHGRGGGLDI